MITTAVLRLSTLCGVYCLLVVMTSPRGYFVAAAPTQTKQQQQQQQQPVEDPDRDPITRNLESTEDANVKDLESLKHSLGKTLELMKSQTTDYASQDKNGNNEDMDGRGVTTFAGHPHQTMEESRADQTVPDRVAAPPRKNEANTKNGNRRTSNNIAYDVAAQDVDKEIREVAAAAAVAAVSDPRSGSNSGTSGTQYSPLDMAEYIFWTGDEKGVTLAIEEFLQEELMTREEAISFLQEIKYNLEYLQSHYNKLGLNAAKGRNKDETVSAALSAATTSSGKPLFSKDKQRINGEPKFNNNFDITRLRQEPVTKKDLLHSRFAEDASLGNTDDYFTQTTSNNNQPPNLQLLQAEQLLQHKLQHSAQPDSPPPLPSTSTVDLNTAVDLLDRLHTADLLYTEYSLEEVIYQLARVMFQQALMRGDAEAQQTLARFTRFLETEADQARISRSLEKTVFDVLIAALADTLAEHPELTNAGPDLAQSAATILQKQQQRTRPSEVTLDGRNILRQALQLNANPAAHSDDVTTSNRLGFRNDLSPMRIPFNTVKYKAK